MKKYVVFALLSAVLVGCTVAPKVVVPKTPSWDSGRQDSGVIRLLPDMSVVVTTNLLARFNALAATYGSRLSPPRSNAWGFTMTETNTVVMSQDAMAGYMLLSVFSNSNQRIK